VVEATVLARPLVLAFYLPQFHPIPENDQWWEPGFTEWTNVAAAKPLFPGHAQPRLPGELGFYDLRVPEVRYRQAALARQYGVDGFVYWHYWFAGRRLLERPFDEALADTAFTQPFCLAWANESWTGVWHGAPGRILMEQTYPGNSDHAAHFEAVLPALSDPRYIRVDGRPLFYVRRPELLEDARRFTDQWRELASRAGLPGLYFIAEITEGRLYDVRDVDGFDAIVYTQFPVRRGRTGDRLRSLNRRVTGGPDIFRYEPVVAPPPPQFSDQAVVHPCVCPNFDNTPRSRRRGIVIVGTSPNAFRAQVDSALSLVRAHQGSERLLFVKSWNEWAEGNYLEPDRRYKRLWLEALKGGLANW
jgi:lipopolysaccharide biosynthesis protein